MSFVSNVNILAAISEAISAVTGITTEIVTTSNNVSKIVIAADNIDDIITVADIGGVALQDIVDNKDNINVVGSDITAVNTNANNMSSIVGVAAIIAKINSLFADKATLDSLFADKSTLDSLFADKATLDSLFADKSKLDSLFNDKSVLDSLYADKAKLDSLFADKTTLDSLSADKTQFDAIYANMAEILLAAESLTNFENQYISQATAPTSPIEGMLWFDTVNDLMKVYDGNGFVNAGSSVNGTSERQTYTATQGQTTFSSTYDSGFVDVYLNGIKLLDGTDFTATNGSSVVLASGANAGDIVDIVAYGTFELADVYTQAQADNLLDAKQNTLVSGSNIKTIQGTSLLGSGNIQIEGVPSGVITMWSGSVSSIPTGWYLCNGSNGTPDLRNRFVYGASNDAEVNTTGGSANAVVVSHSHTGSTNTTGNHTHTYRSGDGNDQNMGGGSLSYEEVLNKATSAAGNHSHTVTVNSSGESGTNKNLPPYMKLAYIMKG